MCPVSNRLRKRLLARAPRHERAGQSETLCNRPPAPLQESVRTRRLSPMQSRSRERHRGGLVEWRRFAPANGVSPLDRTVRLAMGRYLPVSPGRVDPSAPLAFARVTHCRSLKIQWLPIRIQFITVNLSKCYKRFILAVAQSRSLFGLADGASDFLLLTSRM